MKHKTIKLHEELADLIRGLQEALKMGACSHSVKAQIGIHHYYQNALLLNRALDYDRVRFDIKKSRDFLTEFFMSRFAYRKDS